MNLDELNDFLYEDYKINVIDLNLKKIEKLNKKVYDTYNNKSIKQRN